MDLSQLYTVARLGRTHGLKGDLKFLPMSSHEQQFAIGTAVVIADRKGRECLDAHIESVQILNAGGIIRFREITDHASAERFEHGSVLVAEDNLIALGDGEYYVHQLVGLEVVDENHRRIGTLTDVISQANHDVYEIEHHGHRSLVPAVAEFIRSIDLKNRTMTIRVIPGLLD